MHLPPPVCGELSRKVAKLLKCQDGLKQAGCEWHLLLATWLVEETGMEQCKPKSCDFPTNVENEGSLMIGVHVNDLTVSGEQGMYYELFDHLEQCFPVKSLRELNMYRCTGCSFERDWDNEILEMSQTRFAENMVEQYKICTTWNIPRNPVVYLGQRKDGEPGGYEESQIFVVPFFG